MFRGRSHGPAVDRDLVLVRVDHQSTRRRPPAVDADSLYPRARGGLLVGDDRQRFISRLRETARHLGSQGTSHRARVLGSGREVDLIVMAHQHHATALEGLSKLLQGAFDAVPVCVRRLLQLANLQRPVRAEEDRLQRGRNIVQAAGSRSSTWIGPNRSFCWTRITERRMTSSTATKVTTASRRSCDSRISSMSSSGPRRSLLVTRSSFSSSVHVRPCTTSGRGGMRASTLLKAATR